MKKALVTGGCHGLGRALVSSLIKQNYLVTILDCDADTLNELSQVYPNKIKTYCIDLADQTALNVLISELIKSGPYKQVILNAGINATGKFEEISAVAYQNLLMINTQSALLISATFIKNEAIESGGSVIFISSLSHAVGYPGGAVYAASKDCIAIYAKSIRKAYATLNISVLTVFPGPIKTSHAERHAPIGADASKRMEPDVLA
jgi:cyclic-di-GMP-binding biofilm dispersal mediator protein